MAGALVATVVAIVLTFWLRTGDGKKPLNVPRTLPSEINQQLSGYTFTRSDEGRQVFSVHAARTVAFKEGGTTVLEDVFVEVFGQTGERRDVLRTRRCDYTAQSGDLFSAGKVEIELNAPPEGEPEDVGRGRQPVHLQTSRLSFRQKGALVVSDEPVDFRIGAASGSARGMVYAAREGCLELKRDISAQLQLRVGGDAAPPLRLTARRARYTKDSGEILLWGPVEFTQGGRRVTAGRGTLFLDKDNRIVRAVLEEGAQVSEASEEGSLEGSAQRLWADFDPPSGELRLLAAEDKVAATLRQPDSVARLAAQQVEVSFSGAQAWPQNGSATGDVRIGMEPLGAGGVGGRMVGVSSAERKELSAAQVLFTFQSASRSLKDAQSVGPGKLVVLPDDPRVGERVITAGQFLMAFDARGRLASLRGRSGTEIVFHPPRTAPPGRPPAISSAEQLEATFDTPTQALRALRQFKGFRFREGDRQASAEQAQYSSPGEILTLAGNPRLSDPNTRIRAEHVIFDLRADTAEGVGKVRSSHVEDTGGSGSGLRGEPTNVLADRVVAKQDGEFIHYEGNVRVWRGQDVVEAASLDIDPKERRITSGSRVRTSHLQPASQAPGSGQGATRPLTIQADRLEYFDQGRKASYQGNVHLRAENTLLQADRVDVYFAPAGTAQGAEVDRAVATGHVRVEQPMRRATGGRAEYFAVPGKILLTEGPPAIYDEEKGFTTGQRLTFFIRDDTLVVDGGDESPTISRHRIAQ